MSDKLGITAEMSGDSITIHYKGVITNIQKTSRPKEFKQVADFIKKGDTEGLIRSYADIRSSIESYTKNKMSVEDGQLIDKETKKIIPNVIAKKLMALKNSGEDFTPLLRFWNKLKTNPSENSVNQLYSFMEKNNVPITILGDLVLEKGVRQTNDGRLVDEHTRKFDNSIGMVVEMNRKDVVDDPNQSCSAGLHVAAPEYVRDNYSSSIIVEVIVNPADVVSVPVDYNATKMRVCRYQIMGLAKHSTIEKLVVNMEDFVMLPKLEERYDKHRENDNSLSTLKDLMKLTAQKIIDYVKDKTGIKIKANLKNKQGIAKKAEVILSEHGVSELPNSESSGLGKELIFSGLTCNQIMDLTTDVIGAERTNELAGNNPRRARFIAKIIPILKELGYIVVD